jgi:hypothetical protein
LLAEADRDVKILRNQIEKQIRDEEINSDPRMRFQKALEEVQEGRLTQKR